MQSASEPSEVRIATAAGFRRCCGFSRSAPRLRCRSCWWATGAAATRERPRCSPWPKASRREHGIATLAIDGPVNGERETNDDAARLLRKQDREMRIGAPITWRSTTEWSKTGAPRSTPQQQLPEIGNGPVGYWGLSMGYALRRALHRGGAAHKGRGHRAVRPPRRRGASQRVYDDASKIDMPVLFLQQTGRRRGRPARVPRAVSAHRNGRQATARQSRRRHAGAYPDPSSEASRLFLARKLNAQRDV